MPTYTAKQGDTLIGLAATLTLRYISKCQQRHVPCGTSFRSAISR